MKVKMCRYYVQIDCTEKGPPGVIKLNIPPPPGEGKYQVGLGRKSSGEEGKGKGKGK